MHLDRDKKLQKSKYMYIYMYMYYRHPSAELKCFIDYIDKILSKVAKENKLIFMMGDFSINLLNYESYSGTDEFLNNMISRYLLPYILHPTLSN